MRFEFRFLFGTTIVVALIFSPSAGVSSAHAGIISGSVEANNPIIATNLTTQGTQDSAVWGFADGGTSTSLTPDVQKSGGSGIGDLTNISNGNPLRGLGQFRTYGETPFMWTNGNTVPSATEATTGIQHNGSGTDNSTAGEGFSFSVAADTELRTLMIFTTINEGDVSFQASLSDDSAAP
jgi:hypothetical protein